MMAKLVEQFANPGAEYRGKPFWSWNGDLKADELIRQIHVMKEMGLGGFFTHSRTGLITEYLGDEWFRLTNLCADEAEKLGMEAWLYDEDRWPSGAAGGMVTARPEFRQKFISLRKSPGDQFLWNDGIVAAFSCRLDGIAYADCNRIFNHTPSGWYRGKTVLVFTVEPMQESSFFNGYTDVDRLRRDATETFIQLTHEKYKERCGTRFGKSILGIFTDEPHRGSVMTGFGLANENRLWMAPWTEALPAWFKSRFGYDIIERLPEIFLNAEGQAISQVKWHYMETLQAMFLESFAKPIYEWCKRNHLLFTGHALHEDSLTSQAAMQGSLMRFYETMHYPGVDVLTEGNRNYWIVKQLASAARQLGQKWLLSELYGCTGWQMNFESHKAVGDWQALFGINLRCHHLSWYTMEGEAKRDYPASILHQSAWWKDYHWVETYFARLGLMLSRGKPCCDLLVLNPVESVWSQIHSGWAKGLSAQTAPLLELEKAYQEIFFWLAGAQLDFDYGDEEMIGRLYRILRDPNGKAILRVGQAAYRAVIIPRMATIRSSTVKMLDEFIRAGGIAIFAGELPEYTDAVKSSDTAALRIRGTHLSWDKDALCEACAGIVRHRVEILDAQTDGRLEEIFCQLRSDQPDKYLVAINVNRERWFKGARIRVSERVKVAEWDCLTGERWAIPAQWGDEYTEFVADFAPSGSHVYVLTKRKERGLPIKPILRETRREAVAGPFAYAMSEPNVCVLDMARYRIEEREWQPETEVLKVDRAVRKAFGLPFRSGEMIQPWYRNKTQPQPEIKGKVRLAFDFHIEQALQGPVILCMERPERFSLKLNGEPISNAAMEGWWVDTAFQKVPLPSGLLRAGANELECETIFHEGINIEALYLIGDFGVRVEGTKKILTALPEKIAVGDLTAQGFAFYGGAITYKIPAAAKLGDGERAFIVTPKFEAACVKVMASSGKIERLIAWQPYEAEITEALAPGGKDVLETAMGGEIELEVVLTRRNTFGPLHQIPLKAEAYGPGNFTTEGENFSQNYMLYPSGLLQAPEIYYAKSI
ncbi:MAG: glycosyl hydrolase [Candidatus Sumerlaeota bacterium]|nr:glycosyl hydrolase [Candidatus Sumerlaeota bacterium]